MIERLPSMHEVQYSKQKETQLERDGEGGGGGRGRVEGGEWGRGDKKKRSLRGMEKKLPLSTPVAEHFSTVPLGGAHKQLYSVQMSGKFGVRPVGRKPPTEKDQRAKQPY